MSLDESLKRLPIFPLPWVQLFPHALLPLHVFETRYRTLIKDCLAGDQMMAIATLEPGFEEEYHARPPVKTVCGMGKVIAHEALPDGRSNILLRGVARVQIVSELPPDHVYRVVHARSLPDRLSPQLDGADAVQTLILLADRLALRLPQGGPTLRELARSQAEPGPLCDVLAAALVTDAEARQSLLENLDVAARVDAVSAKLAAIVGTMGNARN